MTLLFSYGTLQRGDVQLSTFGRLLEGQRDALCGFEPSLVPIEDPQVAAAVGTTHHANATFNGRGDSRVDGTVFEITDAELADADEYERLANYERVAATLASGKQAWLYVARPRRRSYGKLSTAFYDLDKPAAPADAMAYYLGRALQSNGPVLEPMCGSGRFLLPLLQAGVAIDGVDVSADMLTACRRRAEALGLVATLYEQSLDVLSLPRRYGFAFIPSGSLGLIPQKGSLRASLRALRRHLAAGATLLIEMVDTAAFDAESGAKGSRAVVVEGDIEIQYEWHMTRQPGSDTVHWSGRYQRRDAGSVLAEEFEEIVLQLYDSREVLDELQFAGFSNARVVRPTGEMAWLRESGCSLYACEAPAR